MRERDGLFGLMTAEVDGADCSGCGICVEVCTENAVRIKDGKACLERKERCRACNLCVLKCPTGAIRLINGELLERLKSRFRNDSPTADLRHFMQKKRIGFKDLLTLPGNLKK